MANPTLPFLIPIRAIDAVSGPMRRITAMLGGARMKGALANVGRGLATVRDWTKKAVLGLGAMAVAGGAAMFAIAKATADRGDALGELAEQIGFGTTALQEYQYAGQIAGVSQETMNTALLGFTKRLGEAKAGTGSLASFLGKVSPELLEQVTAAGSAEEAFGLYLDAVGGVGDETKRAALLQAAFGRGASSLGLLATRGADGIAELRGQAHEFGAVMSEEAIREAGRFDEATINMTAALGGARNMIGAQVMPILSSLMERLTGLWKKHLPAVQAAVAVAGAWMVRAFETGWQAALLLWPEVLKGVGIVQDLLAWLDPLVASIGGWGTVLAWVAGIVGGVLVAAFGAWAISVLAATWPILAIGAAIAVVAYFVVKYWDEISAVFAANFAFLEGLVTGFIDIVGGMWDWLKEKFLAFVDWLPDFDSLVPEWVRDIFGGDGADLAVDTTRRELIDRTGEALEDRRVLDQQANVSVELKGIPPGSAVKAKNTPGMGFELDTGYASPSLAGGV
jgi:hypothetical protein